MLKRNLLAQCRMKSINCKMIKMMQNDYPLCLLFVWFIQLHPSPTTPSTTPTSGHPLRSSSLNRGAAHTRRPPGWTDQRSRLRWHQWRSPRAASPGGEGTTRGEGTTCSARGAVLGVGGERERAAGRVKTKLGIELKTACCEGSPESWILGHAKRRDS